MATTIPGPGHAAGTPATAPATAPRLLREVARLHVRAQRRALACTGAGATQCTILTELGRAPSMTLAELSRRLRLDKGWTSRAVGQLVQDGLVAKTGTDGDRRVVALSLTRAGVAQHARLEGALDAHVAGVIARVPAEERAAVGRALRLLHDAYAADAADAAEPTAAASGRAGTPCP